MPKYRSTNDETRYYPTLGLVIEPDAVVDLPEEVSAAGLEPVADAKKKATAQEIATDVAETEGE